MSSWRRHPDAGGTRAGTGRRTAPTPGSDRLTRLRYWPSAVYTEHLSARWRAANPPVPTPEIEVRAVAANAERETPRRIAVVCHAFYPDLVRELRVALANLPAGFDLFVSIVDEEHRATVLEQFHRLPAAAIEVRAVPNRGRDIAPKYVAFSDVYRRGYDLVLFLHTKKTTSAIGSGWRRHLLDENAGSPERVRGVLELFDRDPGLGVLAPSHYGSVVANTGWHGSYPAAAALARRAGIAVRRWDPPDFASGSMFWARPDALRPLTAIGLGLDDFPPERGQNAYTVMHALERMVFVGAATAGFHGAFMAAAPVTSGAGLPVVAGRHAPSTPSLGMRLAVIPGTVAEIAREAAQRRAKLRPARVRAWLVRNATRLRARKPAT